MIPRAVKAIKIRVPESPSTPSVQLVVFMETHSTITDTIKNTAGGIAMGLEVKGSQKETFPSKLI